LCLVVLWGGESFFWDKVGTTRHKGGDGVMSENKAGFTGLGRNRSGGTVYTEWP
jgi:hypothetical protein